MSDPLDLEQRAADLTPRLRAYGGADWETTVCYNGVRDEAADLIRDLLAALRETQHQSDALTAERDEALRRRDAWKAKAEGFDAVRLALREKVGAPWPPHMSRILWSGIAADEKARADALTAEVAALKGALATAREALREWDALIQHQYSGSRAAMSDMTHCAQNTAAILALIPLPTDADRLAAALRLPEIKRLVEAAKAWRKSTIFSDTHSFLDAGDEFQAALAALTPAGKKGAE